MGIFDALSTAVSGLNAQSYALQNISGNIANSQTLAYKRINTKFDSLVADNLPSQQIAGSVIASSSATNNIQGDIQNATTPTFMGINGNGYFIVQKPTSFVDNQPVFGGVPLYTRRGDFQLDKDGFLVNGAGYYLMGNPVDATTGNPLGSIPTTLQFSNNLIPAQITSQINYNANLPSAPKTAKTQAGVPGSDLLNPADFAASPIAGASGPATILGTTATLLPDAPALGTGTVGGIAAGTLVSSFGFNVGDQISVGDGTNTTTYTVAAGDTIGTMMAALNGGTAKVNVSIVAGNLQVKSTDVNNIDIASISSASNPTGLANIGFAVGNTTFSPTNLMTQSAVSASDTMTVSINGATPQVIQFGPGGVQTLAQLDAALKGLAGVNVANTGIVGTGDVKITAAGPTDTIQLGGSFTPSKFGIGNTQALPSNATVYGTDVSTFLSESIAGGSITGYNGTGAPVNLQFRWAKIDSSDLGPGHTDTWNMFYQTDSTAGNAQPAWINVGQNFTFNASGQLVPPVTNLTLNNVQVDGLSLGNVQVAFGAGGLTQFSNTNGTVQVNLLDQNGASAGQLQSIAVDGQGRIVGTYSNGRTVPLADVTLANFNGQNQLKELDGGAYEATADSGPPLLNATGKIVGSAVEASNTDIADEFSKLIVTQQAYSANTRIITTTNTMVQDLLNVIR
jgi:flagellar hook protein FlgE